MPSRRRWALERQRLEGSHFGTSLSHGIRNAQSHEGMTRDAEGKSVVSKILWRIFPFLFLLYVVAYLDRINIGFAALQMRQQLGFSDETYGLGAGLFFVGYLIFQVPSNLVLQR